MKALVLGDDLPKLGDGPTEVGHLILCGASKVDANYFRSSTVGLRKLGSRTRCFLLIPWDGGGERHLSDAKLVDFVTYGGPEGFTMVAFRYHLLFSFKYLFSLTTSPCHPEDQTLQHPHEDQHQHDLPTGEFISWYSCKRKNAFVLSLKSNLYLSYLPHADVRDRRCARSHVMEPQYLRKFLGLGLAGVGALQVAAWYLSCSSFMYDIKSGNEMISWFEEHINMKYHADLHCMITC